MPRQKTSNSRNKPVEGDRETRREGMTCCRHHNSFWGVVLVMVGFIWLAKSVGWLDEVDIPLFPLVLICLGVYFLVRSNDVRPPSRGNSSSS